MRGCPWSAALEPEPVEAGAEVIVVPHLLDWPDTDLHGALVINVASANFTHNSGVHGLTMATVLVIRR